MRKSDEMTGNDSEQELIMLILGLQVKLSPPDYRSVLYLTYQKISKIIFKREVILFDPFSFTKFGYLFFFFFSSAPAGITGRYKQ